MGWGPARCPTAPSSSPRSYPTRPGYLVLRDFSLTLPPCKTVAIVGPSGGGTGPSGPPALPVPQGRDTLSGVPGWGWQQPARCPGDTALPPPVPGCILLHPSPLPREPRGCQGLGTGLCASCPPSSSP